MDGNGRWAKARGLPRSEGHRAGADRLTELADAAAAIAAKVARGALKPEAVDEALVVAHLYQPAAPDVDLFLRPSGEQRTSNFLVWQLAFAEMVFMDVLWPDFDRGHLWQAVETYAARRLRRSEPPAPTAAAPAR